jgi:FAD/FMN-containing dehydrogenase
VRWTGPDQITVDAGASWDDVAIETLKRGLIPPVMTDMQLLSVGGTLSAGGTGEMSLRLGAQVDHVTALEVVTGTGTIESCSVSTNEELFRMTLAGMGQCALIGRASLQLTKAPQGIALRRLLYDHADDLLFDLRRLATTGTFETMGAEITRNETGWSMELLLGSFLSAARASASILPRDLRFASENEATRTSLLAWLRRRTHSVVSALQSPLPNVPLILTIPATTAGPFLADLLSGSDASIGVWRIEVLPMVTARFTQPLHRLPDEPFAFSIRIQRRASARNALDHLEMLRQNDGLVRTYVPSGAKIYPPFAPSLSQREWQLHFGPVWERFTRAKDRYDPKRVLTPGAGIFI